MIILTREQINEVADHIVGTIKGIDQGLKDCGIEAEQNDLSPDTLAAFDELFFVCDVCGWTCDIDESSSGEGEVCYECREDEEIIEE